VAVLFGAAATYGRLSADNEFVACRSSGINLHVLFAPALTLGLLSGAVTYGCLNFVIPQVVRNLDHFLEADVMTLLQRRLDQPRGIRLDRDGRGLRISADRAVVSPEDPNAVSLHGIAFLEVERNKCVRYGTAEQVSLRFERKGERLRASGRMVNLSFFDLQAERFAELAEQVVATRDLPTLVPRKIKFLNLPQLVRYLSHPERWDDVAAAMDELRVLVARRMVHDWLADQWAGNDRTLTLRGPDATFTLSSAGANRLPRDGGIELTNAEADIVRASGEEQHVRASRIVLEAARGATIEEAHIQLDAYDARVSRAGQTSTHEKKTLRPADLPDSVVREVPALSSAQLLSFASGDAGPLAEQQAKTRRERGETVRRIAATLHERHAFSASVLVLVLLGAALGIVFRGAQAVVAFGISFVPSLLVIVTIVMGKQMANNAGTHGAGLLMIWSGILLVAVLDVWVLARVVRR